MLLPLLLVMRMPWRAPLLLAAAAAGRAARRRRCPAPRREDPRARPAPRLQGARRTRTCCLASRRLGQEARRCDAGLVVVPFPLASGGERDTERERGARRRRDGRGFRARRRDPDPALYAACFTERTRRKYSAARGHRSPGRRRNPRGACASEVECGCGGGERLDRDDDRRGAAALWRWMNLEMWGGWRRQGRLACVLGSRGGGRAVLVRRRLARRAAAAAAAARKRGPSGRSPTTDAAPARFRGHAEALAPGPVDLLFNTHPTNRPFLDLSQPYHRSAPHSS